MEELSEFLAAYGIDNVKNYTSVVVDESMQLYIFDSKTLQVLRQQRDAPVYVYCPRKPDPNGFFLYLLVTWISGVDMAHHTDSTRKYPYVLGCSPLLPGALQHSPQNQLRFLHHCLQKHIPNQSLKLTWTVDSGFGSLKLVEEFAQLYPGHTVIASITDQEKTVEQLAKILETHLINGENRLVRSKITGIIVGLSKMSATASDGFTDVQAQKLVATNAFRLSNNLLTLNLLLSLSLTSLDSAPLVSSFYGVFYKM